MRCKNCRIGPYHLIVDSNTNRNLIASNSPFCKLREAGHLSFFSVQLDVLHPWRVTVQSQQSILWVNEVPNCTFARAFRSETAYLNICCIADYWGAWKVDSHQEIHTLTYISLPQDWSSSPHTALSSACSVTAKVENKTGETWREQYRRVNGTSGLILILPCC